MAQIPRAAVDYLTNEVNTISADAKAKVLRVLEAADWSNVTNAANVVVQAVNMVLANSTALSAQASANFYDEARRLEIGAAYGAVAYSGFDPSLTENAVRAFVQKIVDGKPVTEFNDAVLDRVDYEIKRSQGYSITENAARDSADVRYARVPTGAETCTFCLMLASRGFVYHTRENAGAVDHYHTNCDCRVVPGFSYDTSIEGYDPNALYKDWRAALEKQAEERAERNGTTKAEELRNIERALSKGATASKRRKREAQKA